MAFFVVHGVRRHLRGVLRSSNMLGRHIVLGTAVGIGGTAYLMEQSGKDFAAITGTNESSERTDRLQANLTQTLKIALGIGSLVGMFRYKKNTWVPARYQSILNWVGFLRPGLTMVSTGGAYCLTRHIASSYRDEMNDPGHFRPYPGATGGVAAGMVYGFLWKEGLPHFLSWGALFVAISVGLDALHAFGYPFKYNWRPYDDPDQFPSKGHWEYYHKLILPHNREADRSQLYVEPEFLPHAELPFAAWNTPPVTHGEARIRNPFAGSQVEVKNLYRVKVWKDKE